MDPRADSEGKSQRRGIHRWWVGMIVAIALLVPMGIATATTVFNDQFDEREIASCTATESRQLTTRRAAFRARITTDCGAFRGDKHVPLLPCEGYQCRGTDDLDYEG